MSKLIVKIAGDGQVSIEGEGFHGPACLAKSKKYLEGLGKTESTSKKPEFFEAAETLQETF